MKRAAAAASLLLVSAAAAALAAEGLVRWLRPGFVAGAAAGGNPFWRHDKLLGWFHRPGQQGLFSREEFTHRVSINSLGFRDPERRLPDPSLGNDPGRIAFFGDSFTWGHGVEDGEIFTRLLEAALPGSETWNMGVSGYSTDQELLLFRKYGRDVRAGLVVVMISRNDFEGNASAAYSAYPKPFFEEKDGALVLAGVPVPERGGGLRALEWLRRRSAFANGLAWRIGFEGALDDRPRLDRTAQIGLTLELLDLFSSEAREAGARFAVGLVPSVAHVYFGPVPELEKRRFDAVREWADGSGVPALDLVPCFREAFEKTGRWYHYRHDKHWDAAGHALAARCLAGRLRGEGSIQTGG